MLDGDMIKVHSTNLAHLFPTPHCKHPSPLPTTSFTAMRKVEASANVSLLRNLPKLSERQFGKKSAKVFSFSYSSIVQLQVALFCF